jgi:hypothetical protein
VVEDVKTKTLKGIILNEVEGDGAHIITDQTASCQGLGKEGANRRPAVSLYPLSLRRR